MNNTPLVRTTAISAFALMVCLLTPSALAASPTLEITNFIGTVEIRTGDYDTLALKTTNGVSVKEMGDRTIIDGGHDIATVRCRTKGKTVKIGTGTWKWLSRSKHWSPIEDYPNMVILAPKHTQVEIENSLIFASIGDVATADIEVRSCGDVRLGNVAGDVNIRVSGAGDLEMGSVGNADIYVSGAGNVTGQSVGNLEARISGSGDLELGDVHGTADIVTSGSGDVSLGSIQSGLKFKGSGSSDLQAMAVRSGDVEIMQSGAGDVDIEGGDIDNFTVRASGASDINYGGSVQNADIHVSGASSVSMRKPSGEHKQKVSGAGSVSFDH